jgi:hypothetical protein
MIKHTYVLLEKPPALSEAEWRTVLQALVRVLGQRGASSMPAKRAHYALSLDGSKVLLEGVFDLADLDPDDLTRLCKYVSTALDNKYTPAQVREGLRDRVTVFQGATWRDRGAAARARMRAEREEWEDGIT